MPPKCFFIKTAILAFFCSCAVFICRAQPVKDQSGYGLFNKVAQIKKAERVEFTRLLYKKNCRQLSPAQAMAQLDQLTRLAQHIDDKALECAVYDMRADYYSVNKGYNRYSTNYHLQGIQFATDNNMLLEEGIYQHRLGIYFSIYKKNSLAINYLLKSLDAFKKIGYYKVPDISLYFFQTGDFYYGIDDYENAKAYALKALKYKTLNTRLTINTINTIGLIYRNTRHFDIALKYFNQAIAIAVQQNDSVWIGIAKGNVGSVYFMQKQYDKALPFIIADYNTSLKYGETYNAALALLRHIAINIERANLKEAGKQLGIAEKLSGEGLTNVILKTELYRLQALYYEKTGNIAAAYAYRKKLDVAQDSMESQDNLDAVERVKMKWEQEKYQNSIKHLKSKAATDALQRNTIIVVFTLLAIILGLVYNRKLLKAKADSELLKIDKLRVDQELSNAASELLLYTQNLQEKNTIIQSFKEEIEQLNVQFTDNEKNEQLNTLLQASIMTDASWIEFKRLYLRVHPGFFNKLKETYPSVSETDQRLLALIKLEINNREMATMLGITPEGIKKAKQRLRKKMNLDKDIAIETALSVI
jgi:hypothetical protein